MKIIPGRRSSVYNAFTDNSGGLVFGVGDMAIHAEVTPEVIRENREVILSPEASMVVFDGNLAAESIDVILAMCHGSGKPTFFEPTDLTKATKVFTLLGGSSFARFCKQEFGEKVATEAAHQPGELPKFLFTKPCE